MFVIYQYLINMVYVTGLSFYINIKSLFIVSFIIIFILWSLWHFQGQTIFCKGKTFKVKQYSADLGISRSNNILQVYKFQGQTIFCRHTNFKVKQYSAGLQISRSNNILQGYKFQGQTIFCRVKILFLCCMMTS